MKTISIEVEAEMEQEVLSAVRAVKDGRLLEHACRLRAPGTYTQAAAQVHVDIATSHNLRRRIVEDARRDPVDAVKDAETLLGLNCRRLEEIQRSHRGSDAVVAVG